MAGMTSSVRRIVPHGIRTKGVTPDSFIFYLPFLKFPISRL